MIILRLESIQDIKYYGGDTKKKWKVKDYSYRERLEKLELTTLLEQRIRGDLI